MATLAELQPLVMTNYLEVVGPDEIRIKGHRLGLEHIVERYREGWSAEQITEEFPGLALEKVYAVIAYYLANRHIVEDYLARIDARAEAAYREWAAAPPSPAMARIRALKAQGQSSQKPDE
jgi:uncharacterized protein (DUF433 family)